MTHHTEHNLSSSQEDYLETILAVSAEKGQATISDIAVRMGVSKPSVSSAVDRLVRMGFALHDSYGAVELTKVGRRAAQTIAKRHVLLERFLADILLLDPKTAEKDACSIEHHLSSATVKAIMAFFDYMEGQPDGGKEWLAGLHRSISSNGEGDVFMGDTLNRVAPGECVNVVRIAGSADLRRRLIEMGIAVGARLYVQRVAPLGDPMAVEVGGTSVSLRKSEASLIVVERCEGGRGKGKRMGLRRRGSRRG